MNSAGQLSLAEFWADIRFTVASPKKRFAVIHERGALWGSLLLLLTPAYIGFAWVGGIYFNGDPFPGYSFLVPLAAAIAITLLKIFLLHICALFLQWKRESTKRGGSFRELTAVFGYAGLPNIAALLVAIGLFLFIPELLSTFFREHKTVAFSVMIAFGIALFIWHLILLVLALRLVYPLRDVLIVIAIVLGTALSALTGTGMMRISKTVGVPVAYLEPILSKQILRFHSAGPGGAPHEAKADLHIDLLRYRIKTPEPFELVAFVKTPAALPKEEASRGKFSDESLIEKSISEGEKAVGRIVAMPGDTVQFAGSGLIVNGRRWMEPYIAADYSAKLEAAPKKLGANEYLLLPDNRLLITGQLGDWVFGRNRILGRVLLHRWPLGWWYFQPTVFQRPQLE